MSEEVAGIGGMGLNMTDEDKHIWWVYRHFNGGGLGDGWGKDE
jgi:hypothetical protein